MSSREKNEGKAATTTSAANGQIGGEVSSGRNKVHFKIVWAIHFLLSVSVLAIGLIVNGESRKLLKANVDEQIPDTCKKAYVNVLADDEQDDDAILCCDSKGEDDHPLLCGSLTSYLPLANRLTKFPDAWLLPLFPILIRFLSDAIHRAARSTEFPTFSRESLYRFALYIFILVLRGFVLYLGFNALEDAIVKDAPDTCWHDSWLSSSSTCRGYQFDYSDHIVLYFGQMLALPLVEVFQSVWRDRFWGTSNKVCGTKMWYPKVLLVALLYLYLITLLNAYKTAAYFHTGLEVAIGYFISLIIQIPLFLLQATHILPSVSSIFFG